MQTAELELRRHLAEVCAVLFRLRLVDYMGHPSVRLPGTRTILIKPRHSADILAQDRITPEDMATIDEDGNHLAGKHLPPSERFIHTEIYRARPDVQAIVHTHQPMATMMSIGEAPILPVLHVEGEVAATPIPTWPHAVLVTTQELGAQVADTLAEHQLVQLQGHGVVSVANGLPQAALQAIHLERLAEANWRVLAMGRQPHVIPRHELQQRSASGVGWQVRWAYYRQLAGL